MIEQDWGDAVGHALYGDDWHDSDYSDGISDLVPLIAPLGRTGWINCPGGDSSGHAQPITACVVCRACGATFALLPDRYVPRHDAPSVQALIDAAIGIAEAER